MDPMKHIRIGKDISLRWAITTDGAANRVFSEEIWLAATDAPENWKDIPIEEAEQLKRQQEELANSQPTEEERGEGTTLNA